MNDQPLPLRLLRRDDDGDLEPQEAPVPVPVSAQVAEISTGPLVTLQGGQMAWHEDARAAISHGFAVARLRARTLSKREGGVVNGLLNAKPPSVAEQCQYAQSRAWVPPGHDGGFAEKAGVIYHVLIGRPGVALGDLIAGITSRPLRFALAVLTILVIVLVAWLA